MPKILTSHTAPSYASAPDNPMLGDIYFNTTDDSTYLYTVVSNVNTWVKLGGNVKVQAYDTPGSYTWTRPENVQWLKAVVVIGAGGGGGCGGLGARSNGVAVAGGGGGSGGSTVIAYDLYVGNLSTISISVPSGGPGGTGSFSKPAAGTGTTTATTAAGSAGSGAATFGSYISCPSGNGGGGGTAAATGTATAAVAGGTAPSAPTVSGVYKYVSLTGGAGGAGGGVTSGKVPSGGTAAVNNASSYSADGSSLRQGMNRIQWSNKLLISPRNSQTNPTSSTTGTAFTITAGANPTGGTGVSFGMSTGGSGGAGMQCESGNIVAVAGSNSTSQAGYNASIGSATNSSSASTITIDGGKSQTGGNYGNGGGGGSGVAVAGTTVSSYNPHDITLTACAGGNGAGGLVSIAWVE